MQAKEDRIDLALFEELDVAKNRVVLHEDFADADEIKVTIQAVDAESLVKFIEEEIATVLKEQFDKPCVFVNECDFEGKGIPLFSEVLRPVTKIEKVEITKEGETLNEDVELLSVEHLSKGDQQIVYGIVYEPDTKDAQGDQASEEEIRKAAHGFMEKAQNIKLMHKGKNVNVKILESFLAPVEFEVGKRTVKKGSWVLATRVLDKKLWKSIKEGKLTGYSMAGTAKVE
jgi:hypothetical protein